MSRLPTILEEEYPEFDPATAGRWILGHQTFHLQLITMMSVLESCQQSLDGDDPPRLVSSLHDLAVLFDASTANMVYTASFSPMLYEQAVRPSMMPPQLSPGFSGQLSLEHGLLMVTFKRLKSDLLAKWEDHESSEVMLAFGEVMAAIRRNRKRHGLVCQRFVPGGTSLLSDFFATQEQEQDESILAEWMPSSDD